MAGWHGGSVDSTVQYPQYEGSRFDSQLGRGLSGWSLHVLPPCLCGFSPPLPKNMCTYPAVPILPNYFVCQNKIMSQYVVCGMQYFRSTRMFYYIRSDFAVCKTACFSSHSGPQSSAQWKIRHICHSVSHKYKQSKESANI